MLDFSRFSHLTFDCYGTLIDWEQGILDAVAPVLRRHRVGATDEHVLRLFAEHEAKQESQDYRPYRVVLQGVMEGLAKDLGFTLDEADLEALPASVGRWPAFADTVESLRRLASRYQLAVLSNIDDVLFTETSKHLGVAFADVVTAQQVGTYKPDPRNFEALLERLRVPKEGMLHVAQSVYHDHVPAKALGLSTVWVNRPSRRAGTGVALPAEATPDLEVPDLATLVRTLGL
ncbi:MAG: haloacid dehalogenase type II [Acidobacteriota bacterium]